MVGPGDYLISLNATVRPLALTYVGSAKFTVRMVHVKNEYYSINVKSLSPFFYDYDDQIDGT